MLWTPGQKLRNRPFEIVSVLGQGGFGITYKAQHQDLKHEVVLKTPNPLLQSDPEYPRYVRRFIKEGQILAQLSQKAHPSIVQVSDFFEEGSLHCLVMDLVPGDSLLNTVSKQGRLTETEAVNYISQIADALILAHTNNIVHRDAHAGNIMLAGRNKAVLIDFGIAGDIVPVVSNTRMAFNPAFAPYEQILGASGMPTVDVYALGASLYYAVTGQLPTPAAKRKLANISLIPPKQYNPKISDNLDRAIVRAMALEANQRPQTMKDFLALLKPPTVGIKSISPRYQKLDQLLATSKWKEADEETLRVMLQVAGRTTQGYLYSGDIKNFSCEDLYQIDQLWVKSSNGRFGFSVQKRIWQEVGGHSDANNDIICRWGEKVGWKDNYNWKFDDNLNFSLSAPPGHLPCKWSDMLTPDRSFAGYEESVCEGISIEYNTDCLVSLLSRQDL